MKLLKKINSALGGKMFLLFLFVFTFLIVSVFANIGEANYSGIQVDNYFAGSGKQGITENISFESLDGKNHSFMFEDGLLVNYSLSEPLFPSEDLILYYKLDETSGTNTNDATSNGNDGTANNDRIFTSNISGILDTGADFTQGVDDIKIDATGNDITTGTKWTFQVWLNGTNTLDNQYVLDNRPDGESGNLIIRFDSGDFEFNDDSNAQIFLDNQSDILNGNWNHLVLVADGTNLRYYLNGVSTNNVSITSSSFSGSDNVVVGGIRPSGGTSNVDYDGWMDEFGIWNRTLTGSDVKVLYNEGEGLTYGS